MSRAAQTVNRDSGTESAIGVGSVEWLNPAAARRTWRREGGPDDFTGSGGMMIF